jgi:hypothetical protein
MRRWAKGLVLLIVVCAMSAAAQTNTFPASGDVGIGTTSPTVPLQVTGGAIMATDPTFTSINAQLNGTSVPVLNFTRWPGWGTVQHNAYVGQFYNSNLSEYDFGIGTGMSTTGNQTTTATVVAVTLAGNVGIGTTSPTVPLHLAKAYGSNTNIPMQTWDPIINGYGLTLSNFNSIAGIDYRFTQLNGGTSYPVLTFSYGYVGIGTTAPAYNLDVAGVARAQSGIIYPDGNKQMTAWTGVLCGGDYAESVDVSGDRKRYEPGDVLVLAQGNEADVEKSTEPYSTAVAGIFATKPGVVGRRQTLANTSDEVPMAMVGIVPTNVSAENGPIHRGDLLVTASRPGYAMKGTNRRRMLGAVIGKAMGSLDSGIGTIEVLVTLQ